MVSLGKAVSQNRTERMFIFMLPNCFSKPQSEENPPSLLKHGGNLGGLFILICRCPELNRKGPNGGRDFRGCCRISGDDIPITGIVGSILKFHNFSDRLHYFSIGEHHFYTLKCVFWYPTNLALGIRSHIITLPRLVPFHFFQAKLSIPLSQLRVLPQRMTRNLPLASTSRGQSFAYKLNPDPSLFSLS